MNITSPRSIGNLAQNFMATTAKANNFFYKKEDTVNENAFVHPILTTANIAASIAKYNQFIYKYNMQLWIDQAPIRKYNKQVIRFRKTAVISVEQKVKEQIWKNMMKDHTPEEYNEAVEEYNTKNGFQLRKKNLKQPVKPETEKYFIALLYQYNAQLYRRKEFRLTLGVSVASELPKMEIYPNKIIESERNGVKVLPVTVESVRAHRERLEEAGVLTGYSYHGPNRPIKIAFNPQVLDITDNGSSKKTVTDNQLLTPSQTNKVPHSNVSSRNTINKFKIREEGDLPESKSPSSCTKETTKTPKRQDGKNSIAPNRPEKEKKKKFTGARRPADFIKKGIDYLAEKNELSAVLMDTLDDKTQLAQDLSAGKHKNYRPIPEEYAQREAFSGAMHPEDFKELAIQDVFKFSASLFEDLEVHPGSWMNAYKYWLADSFQSFTGKTFKKDSLINHWKKCIEVLREVKKYKKAHPGWNPSFPSLYFDPARTFKENNSFEYALKTFRLDLEKIASKKKRKVAAANSSRHKTDVSKAREKIRQMMKGKISLDRVYEFVRQNCNKQVNAGLNTLIKKEMSKV
jgi:hypothetical protein